MKIMNNIFSNKKIKVFTLGVVLAGMVSFGIIMQSCSNSYDEIGISDVSARQEAEEFGKQMGDNLRYVVTQMNKNGDDFGDLAKIKTAIAKYTPQHTHTNSLFVEELDNTLQRRYRLTPVQLVFLEKIREAQAKSSTADEFMLSLKEIIKEIQTTVPEIQQRNLLKMTVALYYIIQEMDLLLKEGLMPVDLKQPQHIRLRSGSESSIWATLWAGICVSVVDIGAELLAALEAMASSAGVVLVAVAGCLLLTGDTDNILSDAECEALASNCVAYPYKPNGERKECSNCRWYCLTNHKWNHYSCPITHN